MNGKNLVPRELWYYNKDWQSRSELGPENQNIQSQAFPWFNHSYGTGKKKCGEQRDVFKVVTSRTPVPNLQNWQLNRFPWLPTYKICDLEVV